MSGERSPHMLYLNSCPNCGGAITDKELFENYVCSSCLPKRPRGAVSLESVIELLEEQRKIEGLRRERDILKRLREFELLFEMALGSRPWSAQRAWAIRVFKKKSFGVVAPTGVGKTVFGLIMSIYLSHWGKAYVVLPTSPLVIQAEEKLSAFVEGIRGKLETYMERGEISEEIREYIARGPRLLVFHSKLRPKERREKIGLLERGEFDILITTSRFMLKNAEIIGKNKFHFMFIDDVDSVLRSGKSVDTVLRLLGLSDEDIVNAQSIINTIIALQAEVERKNKELASLSSKRGSERRRNTEALWEELRGLYGKIESEQNRLREIRNRLQTILVVSTATGRPRGPRVLLFRELLGFQPGSRPELLRNIVDVSLRSDEERVTEDVIRVVKRLGTGGLVYVPVDKGVAYALELTERLRRAGIRAEAFYHKSPESLTRFLNRDIDVLVGVAIYYGVMVRGLDYPDRIRYAVFAGFPRFKFSAKFEEPHPLNVYRVLEILSDLAPQPYAREASQLMIPIRRFLRRASPGMLQVLAARLRSGAPPERDIERDFLSSIDFIRRALSDDEVLNALKKSKEVIVKEEGGVRYIYIPDLMTYIQASGRTSRLYVGGLTKGLSVVVIDDERLFAQAVRRLRMIFDGMRWEEFESLESSGDLKRILREIDRDRRNVRKAMRGEYRPKRRVDLIRTYLMVVESPNKARTISRFFGRPSIRILGDGLRSYEVSLGDVYLIVVASGGHVYDLATSGWDRSLGQEWLGGAVVLHGVIVRDSREFIPIYTSIRTCRVCGAQVVDPSADHCPRCGSREFLEKKSVVEHLRELAFESDAVLIATDPDTEGEKIGWDIAALLRPYAREIKRVEFHEVTRRAILDALREWRDLNERQVEAQLVRRIEDRWIGFTLSPILWRDFWLNDYCRRERERAQRRGRGDLEAECSQENRKLSAGRVQTPVLGWIIDRYNSSLSSEKRRYVISLENGDKIELWEDELPEDIEDILRKGERVIIREIKRETEEVFPLPPYTTDTMIYDASKFLKFSAAYTMSLAQDLFELGLITYHRTDSTRVSDTGIEVAKEYLQSESPELFTPRTWATGQGGAHEAIRPVRPIDEDLLRRMVETGEIELARPLTKAHYMLYGLIFKRFIASQCERAEVVVQEIEVILPEKSPIRKRYYIGYKTKGFATYYPYHLLLRREGFVEGEHRIKEFKVERRKTVFPYSQGEIVSEMKRRGIGRPSTYAAIVSKLLSRNYVYSRRRTGTLAPTPLGERVYSYLIRNFKDLVSEERTKELEMKMDMVSEGKGSYIDILRSLYEEITQIASVRESAVSVSQAEESAV